MFFSRFDNEIRLNYLEIFVGGDICLCKWPRVEFWRHIRRVLALHSQGNVAIPIVIS